MDFLIALRQDVGITVRLTRKEHGQVSIVLAGISRLIMKTWSYPRSFRKFRRADSESGARRSGWDQL